jgi:hypothetical protein
MVLAGCHEGGVVRVGRRDSNDCHGYPSPNKSFNPTRATPFGRRGRVNSTVRLRDPTVRKEIDP